MLAGFGAVDKAMLGLVERAGDVTKEFFSMASAFAAIGGVLAGVATLFETLKAAMEASAETEKIHGSF